MADETTRALIWVPIIHSPVDQGSMREPIRQLYIRRAGQQKWEEHVQAVENRWRQIRKDIASLNLDYRGVRLYQDGLPTCGREADIVRELVGAGSENHRLLWELMEQGAQLMGTESAELLLEEYELARQVLGTLESGDSKTAAGNQEQLSKRTLQRRDRYIAQRIDRTLQPGETGLLFLGMLHSLEHHVPSDVRIRKLATHQDLSGNA